MKPECITYPDGTQRWYLNDKNTTTQVKNWANERNLDVNNLSNENKLILRLEMKMWKTKLINETFA